MQDLRDEYDADRKSLGGENQNEAGRRLEEFHFSLLRRARLPAPRIMSCAAVDIILFQLAATLKRTIADAVFAIEWRIAPGAPCSAAWLGDGELGR